VKKLLVGLLVIYLFLNEVTNVKVTNTTLQAHVKWRRWGW